MGFAERRAEPEPYPQDHYMPRYSHIDRFLFIKLALWDLDTFCFRRSAYNSDFDSRGQGGFRGGRGGRGEGYPRNFENFNPRGKREYERHSGT